MATEYTELIIGSVALLWTIYQQYKINQMCYTCPFRKGETNANTQITKN